MDSLRQIEEDLKVLIAEVDRKYPEIATASNTAQQTLKSIRESYISEIRNKDINTKTAKLAQSSDLVAPYILLLNYTDISSKLVESALNGIQLLLKYDVVPPSEVQNVLRVVNIQISCNKFDGYIRTLQLLSSLSSILFNDRSGSHENATFNLINTTLLLADPKLTISVSSAGFATAKQLLCAILDLLISIDKSDPRREWLHPVTLSYIEELTLLGGGCDSKTIKASSNMQAFSFDCLLEISRKYDLLGETFSVQLLQNISSRLLQSLENILKCVQVGFTQQLSSTGIFSALSHLSNVFELVRWVLSRDLWGTKLPENDMHVLMHVLHCLRPEISLDQLDLPKKTLANNDSIFKARMEDAATIFSKISFPFSIAQVIGKTSAPVEYGSGNSLLAFFVEFNDDVVDTPKMLAKSSDKAMSATGNILPIVPAYFALDALLSSCLERFYSLDSARNDLNLFSFLLSNLLAETIKVVVAIRNSEGIREMEIGGSNHSRTQLMHLLFEELCGEEMVPEKGSLVSKVAIIRNAVTSVSVVNSAEFFLYCLFVIQCCNRMMCYSTIYFKHANQENNSKRLILGSFAERSLTEFFDRRVRNISKEVEVLLGSVYEDTYESLIDLCGILLRQDLLCFVKFATKTLLLITIGMGSLGNGKACEITVSFICKHSIPLWHQMELMNGDQKINQKSSTRLGNGIEWKHLTMFNTLLQILHIYCDHITDWDCIVDSFEQFRAYFNQSIQAPSKSLSASVPDEYVLANTIRKIERFVDYTCLLSNESLIKLMTSLVALSMSNLTTGQSGLQGSLPSDYFNGNIIEIIHSTKLGSQYVAYFDVAMKMGLVTYSLKMVIDIARKNARRISSIWQMVTSHLKMIASMQNPAGRCFAVLALYDIMLASLFASNKEGESASDNSHTVESHSTSILPPDEQLFLYPTVSELPDNGKAPMLNQRDLFSCLKASAAVNYLDVRLFILKGLMLLLQESGQAILGHSFDGWTVILDLLTSVPLSLIESSTLQAPNCPESDSELFRLEYNWPKEALLDAFTCIKLVVDEYLEYMVDNSILVDSLLRSLAQFVAQTVDVNISFTSVEFLWKVADFVVSSKLKSRDDASASFVFGQMLGYLSKLSTDPRPEIRNCAVNTLVSASTANSKQISNSQWCSLFDNIIFIIFENAGSRSEIAKSINEAPVAPELKKGVKMSVHHSRDSAHKQWNETRALTLRGLLRMLRVSTKQLCSEQWFHRIWIDSVEICSKAVARANAETEVANAGVELLFGMLSLVSDSSIFDEECRDDVDILNVETLEYNKQQLWKLTVQFVPWICANCNNVELALTVLTKLDILYSKRKDFEFRYSENMRILLNCMLAISRPCSDLTICSDAKQKSLSREETVDNKIMDFFRRISTVDQSLYAIFMSTLCEICFSIKSCKFVYSCDNNSPDVQFEVGIRSQHLREQVCEFLLGELDGNLTLKLSKSTAVHLPNIVRRRFIIDVGSNFLGSKYASIYDGDARIESFETLLLPRSSEVGFSLRIQRQKHSYRFWEGEKYTWIIAGTKVCSELKILIRAFKLFLHTTRPTDLACDLESLKLWLATLFGMVTGQIDPNETGKSNDDLFFIELKSLFDCTFMAMSQQDFSSDIKCLIIDFHIISIIQSLKILEIESEISCALLVIQVESMAKLTIAYIESIISEPLCQILKSRLLINLVMLTRQLCNVTLTGNGRFSHLVLQCLKMVMLFEAEPSEEVEFSNDLLQITEYPTNRAYTHEQVADIFLNSSSVFAGKTKFAGIKIFQLSISFLQTHLLEILCDDTIDMILKKDVTMFLRKLDLNYFAKSLILSQASNLELIKENNRLKEELKTAQSNAYPLL